MYNCTWLQALKSGQLPADLKSLSDNIMLDNVDEKHEDMIHDDRGQADGESNDTQEQRNTDSASMEQVYGNIDICLSKLLFYIFVTSLFLHHAFLFCLFPEVIYCVITMLLSKSVLNIQAVAAQCTQSLFNFN